MNEAPETVLAIQKACGLDRIQLHGDETTEYCRRFPQSVLIKALSGRPEDVAFRLRDYPVGAFLLDAADKGRRGGTGKEADWDLAARIARRHPLILAGGLNEANIEKALTRVAPRAVDINSGAEASPGKKDPEKLRRIIGLIRRHTAGTPSGDRLFRRETPGQSSR